MFRTAERTFTTVERTFTTAEYTYRSAEHNSKACYDIIKPTIIITSKQV